MRQAATGDRRAQEIVLTALRPHLVRMCVKVAREQERYLPKADLPDLVQEILTDIASAGYTYDSKKSHFGTWAKVIVRRKLPRFFRDKERAHVMETDLTTPDQRDESLIVRLSSARREPSLGAQNAELHKELERALGLLMPREASVVRHRLDGRSITDIRAENGMTHQGTINHFHAGMEHIRERVEWLNTTLGDSMAAKIESLPEPYRSAFIGIQLDGRSNASVALELKIPGPQLRKIFEEADRRVSEGCRKVLKETCE